MADDEGPRGFDQLPKEAQFKMLVELRNADAYVDEAMFQDHVRNEPGFREWCVKNGVPI